MELMYNPECGTCRGALCLLNEKHLDVRVVEYLKETWTREKLEELLRMLEPGKDVVNPLIMMRTRESAFTEMKLDQLNGEDPEDRLKLLDAMIQVPRLIQRPIFVKDGRAIIGRPADRLLELLKVENRS
ncbi:arsenate reductase [Thraustotheca clavata]|uniref:Arsenate reductase n=1 Tax=Thraustotheca clavata TaxID=74557 RepID=A0A1V9Y8T6_9STRA|nr:arsenate reductase [Thraustotheca clavata]